MIYKVSDIVPVFTLFVTLIFACKKDIPEKAILTGTVIDQVTKQPVEGASVYLGNLPPDHTPDDEFVYPILISTTDKDGRYSGAVLTSSISYVALTYRLNPFIYVSKSGYIGSNYYGVSWLNAGHSFDFSLYHSTKVVINVWNDTISDDRDEAYFGIAEASRNFRYYPGFIGRYNGQVPLITKYCSGRKFNQNFEFFPLWGNLDYTLNFNPFDSTDAILVTAIPDTTTYYSISF